MSLAGNSNPVAIKKNTMQAGAILQILSLLGIKKKQTSNRLDSETKTFIITVTITNINIYCILTMCQIL